MRITRFAKGNKGAFLGWVLGFLFVSSTAVGSPKLPERIHLVVLHVLGHPSYDKPSLRFVFFPPEATFALWGTGFGAHWIVGKDGSIWPRTTKRPFFPEGASAEGACAEDVVAEAAPIYAHVFHENAVSVGIEVAHSGRSAEPFPENQLRSVAWLLRSLMALSGGRLQASSIVGHKDLDRRPAYATPSCETRGCPIFVDEQGAPYRRRVDPPESLFEALDAEGITVPRAPKGDADLRRAEALKPGVRPEVRIP
jgi:hypothetical protein